MTLLLIFVAGALVGTFVGFTLGALSQALADSSHRFRERRRP
jgi:hypothetical protein